MLKENLHVENLILHLSGIIPLKEDEELPVLEKSDISLIQSLARQVVRKIGFTDRQLELAKTKIDDYADEFYFIDNLEEIKNKTALPIREIDRARWIKIAGDTIQVRFTFQKKLISSIDNLKKTIGKGTYDKHTKTHSFDYSEKNLYKIVKAFEGKHFDLDDTVKHIMSIVDLFNVEDHVPGVYNNTIKNLNQKGVEYITKELGEITNNSLILYEDRKFRYGLGVVEGIEKLNTLAHKIAFRKTTDIQISSEKIAVDQLILALEELQRFPLLIILSENDCYDNLVEIQSYVRNLISTNQVSVMFRLENVQDEHIQFNEYVKKNNLNNKIDNNTKIVYILDSKLPKPVLVADWEPKTILMYGNNRSFGVRKIVECYPSKDLVIHYNDANIPLHHLYRSQIEDISG
jgi:hypothetical protein